MGWRMLVVDDSPEFLSFVRETLGSHPDITIVAEAESGEVAAQLAGEVRVDAALIDLYLPGRNGFWTAQTVLDARPDVQVILMSATDDQTYDGLARAVGARGFLSKKAFSVDAVLNLLEGR